MPCLCRVLIGRNGGEHGGAASGEIDHFDGLGPQARSAEIEVGESFKAADVGSDLWETSLIASAANGPG